MSDVHTLDVGRDFSRFPGGRYKQDGRFSGEVFRETLLLPALRREAKTRVVLDSTLGYGSSFLEEAFGGLAREHDITFSEFMEKCELVSEDQLLLREIQQYLLDASQPSLAKVS